MDDVIYLISETFADDAMGQKIPTETRREIFATISSVSRAEWATVQNAGLRSDVVAVTPMVNYCGEEKAIWRGARYEIYRTYLRPNDGTIELYLGQRLGA